VRFATAKKHNLRRDMIAPLLLCFRSSEYIPSSNRLAPSGPSVR
jgi:hypothetical protein